MEGMIFLHRWMRFFGNILVNKEDDKIADLTIEDE